MPSLHELTAAMNNHDAVQYAIADAEHVHQHELLGDVQWIDDTHAQAFRAPDATMESDNMSIMILKNFAETRGVDLQVLSEY